MFRAQTSPGQGGSGEGQAIEQGRDVGESDWIFTLLSGNIAMKNRLYMEVAMGKSWTDWGFSIDMFDNRFDGESILGFVGMINGFEQLMKVIIGRQPEIAVIIRPGMGMIPQS